MLRVIAAPAFAAMSLIGSMAHAAEKPNIVLVFMDNFGW